MGLPTRLGLSAGLVEVNFHFDMNDPPERNVVTLATDVVLCQFNFAVAFQMIDDADVNAVGAENFQIFCDQRRGDHEFPPWRKRDTRLALTLSGITSRCNAATKSK